MKLPSGAELKLNPAPFAEAKELLQAFMAEAKDVSINGREDLPNVVKNIFCAALSSKRLDAALMVCMERSLYRGQKITAGTWEAIENRQDYLEVCFLVAEENLKPFTKSLYAQFADILKKLENIPA